MMSDGYFETAADAGIIGCGNTPEELFTSVAETMSRESR